MQELEQIRKPLVDQPTGTLPDASKKKEIPVRPDPDVEAAIGMSRKWDAREAGREVAETAIKKLTRPPDFFVLFSTIHYEKYGGFQELLNGVWDVLPKGTPLIGGTVSGFTNNYGCYTRGTTALAVSSEDMDVAIGYGKNTKRNPKHAAQQCAQMIKEKLKDSTYENKFLLNLISASIMPNIPTIGRRKIVRSGMSTKLLLNLFGFSQYFFQKGYGRDDEVLEELIRYLPEYRMLGGGTIDDGAALRNYQFFNKDVFTNSVVSLGIKTNHRLDVKTTHNMKKTGIEFNITKTSNDGRIIHEINGKPAFSEFIRLLGWPSDFLNEKNWFKTNYFFPLGFRVNKEFEEFSPRLLGGIFGESFITIIRSKDPKTVILTIDGRSLLKAIDDNLNTFPENPAFGLIASCTTRLETMGDKTYRSRDHILQYFGESPFIEFYVGGESTYSPNKGLTFVNMSFNTAVFWNKN
ncbi:MAG: hypothetical protein IMZ43_06975 [Thermoplasmata archaeon]|nr:hypothetical protein [Thermoplasmata archaeon]MBE3137113.1 hypothetical protein [Thermoplasmata archaeon]MBE3139107.1 hypothetical protein [Thermoplasmata archaeon]